jgi:2'-5' RNA ligase
MSKRVVTSAICVIPPKEIWGSIQEIRQKYDKAYGRWMPHINFIYPFVESKEFAIAEQILKEELSEVECFKVTLGEFGSFSQKGQNLVFLDPKSKELESLYKCVDKHYPGERKVFHAHMTVAQFPKDESRKQMTRLEKNWKPLQFEVRELHMISRVGDDPFEIRCSIPLKGHNGEFTFKTISMPEEKESHEIFVGNLDFGTTEQNLLAFFEKFKPLGVRIPKKDGVGRGFAFVSFGDQKTCIAASSLHGSELKGRSIRIDQSK